MDEKSREKDERRSQLIDLLLQLFLVSARAPCDADSKSQRVQLDLMSASPQRLKQGIQAQLVSLTEDEVAEEPDSNHQVHIPDFNQACSDAPSLLVRAKKNEYKNQLASKRKMQMF